MNQHNHDILVRTQLTPNPLAIKFIVNTPIKIEGKVTFKNKEEAKALKLAEDLFMIPFVEQLHMFENVVTVTHKMDIDHNTLIEQVSSVLQPVCPFIILFYFGRGSPKKRKKRKTKP